MTSCKFFITSMFSFNSWSSRVSSNFSRSTVHLKVNSSVFCVLSVSEPQKAVLAPRLCKLTLHGAATVPVCFVVSHLLVPSKKLNTMNKKKKHDETQCDKHDELNCLGFSLPGRIKDHIFSSGSSPIRF